METFLCLLVITLSAAGFALYFSSVRSGYIHSVEKLRHELEEVQQSISAVQQDVAGRRSTVRRLECEALECERARLRQQNDVMRSAPVREGV